MTRLPVFLPLESVLDSLAREESALSRDLALLEARLRHFEDQERSIYARWVRLEFGPALSGIEELELRLRERALFVQRIERYLAQGFRDREALFLALEDWAKKDAQSSREESADESPNQTKPDQAESASHWDPDEIEARRRAKRDAKREERRKDRQAEKVKVKISDVEVDASKTSKRATPLTALYRMLARRLHPDSPDVLPDPERAKGLWLEVQSAYVSGSVERLLAIAAWIGAGGSASPLHLEMTLSERAERLRAMKRSCRKLELQLSLLKADPAWEFESAKGSVRRKLRSRVAREIEDQAARIQSLLNELEDYVEEIGSPRRPQSKRDK